MIPPTTQPPPLPQKASGLAIASCVLAGITLVMVIVQTTVMVMNKLDRAGGQPTTGDWMLGFAMLGSLCGGGLSGVLGAILGAIGLAQTSRPRRLSLIGLIANVALLLMLGVVMSVSS